MKKYLFYAIHQYITILDWNHEITHKLINGIQNLVLKLVVK